jgi:uncharacterized protein YbjT (DUF2867 family)
VKRKALVVGATGATGKALLNALKADDQYEFIYVLHYRETGLEDHHKVIEMIHSFDTLLDFRLDKVDDVFCCIGTTIKKAGSKDAFAKVDRDYVFELGKWAKIEEVLSFHVISYLGADKESSIFYNRVKGEMEAELIALNLRSLYIYQPPLLKAKRDEFRLGEKIGDIVLSAFSPFMLGGLQKHRPLKVEKLAASMISHAKNNEKGIHYVSSEEMQEIKL